MTISEFLRHENGYNVRLSFTNCWLVWDDNEWQIFHKDAGKIKEYAATNDEAEAVRLLMRAAGEEVAE